jgi:sulfopyruvate decarboxylase subunit beta
VAGVNKTTAVRAIIAATTGEPVVFTTGYSCRIARATDDRPNHFYMTGSMGLASSIGIGVALATRRPTVVVDGDGSLLMNPVGLISAGSLPNLPLLHVVLDDRKYASTGGQEVPSVRADLARWATASGYSRALTTADLDDFTALLHAELSRCTAPVFIRCELSEADGAVPPRIDTDLSLHAARFSTYLEKPC